MEKDGAIATEEMILNWLRDAHAMEQQSTKIFSDLCERLENYPQLHDRLKQYLDTTLGQTENLELALQRHDAAPSTFKDVSAKVLAFSQTLSGMPLGDEVVKAALSAYTFIHMKIGSYCILLDGAKMLGDEKVMLMCNNILAVETSMAQWLKDNLTSISSEYLRRTLNNDERAER